MKQTLALKAGVIIAGAMLSVCMSSAYADDAGTHDFFLSGATAGSTPSQTAPAEDAAPAAVPAKRSILKKQHYAARPTTMKMAHRDMSKDATRRLHAHVRDLRDEKAHSSS